ncbi:hypothetical protein LTR99_009513 [Exophiala xenobiotica]|uniref:DNA replication factor Cdt1 C-terminal domain-containing protein n=1 Tax=Vermiconidia calcicola TaxID=1690605 RepID=A0AAV9PW80_9PEZI|nr:hypothetical protein LTR99_009513 [Exophiala xenobiotica]KAK5428222.1 hypothetical protein LTR34_008595 [Exophiala xenobiotica]KAK5530649.1 hypothetical protein LTR23_010310 [Chaetothyriales sp. CCFEE 6169]KAK5530812.1 hypothetical protein LTR25_008669 [Vermiconidia calcicola]
MAPSLRGSNRVSKRQTPLLSYTKVSKSTRFQAELEAAAKEAALIPVVDQKKAVKSTPKRKRDIEDSESESETACIAAATSKKARLQLATPPDSELEDSIGLDPCIDFRQLSLGTRTALQQEPTKELPNVLQVLISLHDAFLRAFSLHMVHNGCSAPANLNNLMTSVTRLWKKHTVTAEDIQRMLAIYELGSSEDHMSNQLLKHKEGPFKLNLTGGDSLQHSVEYVGGSRGNQGFDEKKLQNSYEIEVEAAFISQRKNPASWLHKDVRVFPRLEFSVGLQTQARKGKAFAARAEILGLSSQAQNRVGSQFPAQASTSSESNEIQTPQIVKDRTLSLLDRVRAKAFANSTAAPQTPETILRRRAMGRIGEVVDILRLKQQQKLGSNFVSSVHSSPGKVRGKVSFSLKQLISDIKGSLAVPMPDAEVRKCFEILANDMPGMWLSIHTVGILQSIVLNGPGPSGMEARKILEQNEKNRR